MIKEYAKKWGRQEDRNFAGACYDQNTPADLIEGLLAEKADETDIREWGLCGAREWREAIAAALLERIEELENNQPEEV